MTGSALQRVFFASLAVLSANGIVGAKRKALRRARKQLACALCHVAQAAERPLSSCGRSINQDSEPIRLGWTAGVDALLQGRERIAAFKGEFRHEGMGQ